MLKRNWALVAFVYLALAEVLSSVPVPDLALCLIEPEHDQQSDDHDQIKRCPAFHTGVALVIENVDTFLERHDKSVVGFFTIVLAVSTIGLWLATIALWKAGEKQFGLLSETAATQSRNMQASTSVAQSANALNRENAFADRRPWLAITDINVTAFKLSTGGAKVDPTTVTRAAIIFTYSIQNFGRTPAKRVRPRYRSLDGVDFRQQQTTADELDVSHRSDTSYQFGYATVWPGQTVTMQKIMIEFQMDAASVRDRRTNPNLFISILYDADGFDDPRQTFEVFRLSAGSEGKAGLTTEFVQPVGINLRAMGNNLEWVWLNRIDQIGKFT
jgi:hypothetical protein